jgi:predicted GNAT family acetyltransferase
MGNASFLWEVGGEVVSYAVAGAPADGMSRVGPVYTPPAHRGKGYGSAVTAAASQWAVDAGAENVLLFTDLANPTSNSIYQAIGYRPVYDATELEFHK